MSACSNETVQLKLDIDQGKPEQKLYPFNWVPATGNMMYMMPQEGTRVSLYFKGDEETSAVAVNCIRSGGGCAKSDYRDKGLTTEHGMQLKLYRDSMGVETPANKFLMDASKGIEISGSRQLHISAAGDVRIEGKEVCISGFEKVRTYTGILKLTEEEELELEVKAKIELSEGDEGQEADIRGERVTYYLAWEHADLSSPMFRYRDEPEDKSFDWWGLAGNVAGGIAVTAGAAMLGAVGAGLAAGTAIGSAIFGGATAAQAAQVVGTAAFLTGSMYVGSQALSDVLSGRLSSSDTYIRRALAGSIVGIFSGASTLVLADAGLLATMGGGFAEGFAGEAITQKLLNENGEIDWAQCIRSGLFTAVMDGGLYAMRAGGTVENGIRARDENGAKGDILINTGESGWNFGQLSPESSLNNRQRELLNLLSNSGDTAFVRKKSVSMNDLRQLTNVTGDEFNMFTIGGRRLIIRGQGNQIRVSTEMYEDILNGVYGKFSGHTHPGISLEPGPADEPFLKMLGQNRSSIWGNTGEGWMPFGQDYWSTQEVRVQIRHEKMAKLYGNQ